MKNPEIHFQTNNYQKEKQIFPTSFCQRQKKQKGIMERVWRKL